MTRIAIKILLLVVVAGSAALVVRGPAPTDLPPAGPAVYPMSAEEFRYQYTSGMSDQDLGPALIAACSAPATPDSYRTLRALASGPVNDTDGSLYGAVCRPHYGGGNHAR